MVRRMRDYAGASASERFVARRVADELKLSDAMAADAIRDCNTGREYSFLVNSYKPRYYYWEGYDMIRKLMLVGMLVVTVLDELRMCAWVFWTRWNLQFQQQLQRLQLQQL